jgi:hypothetical protein
MKGYVSNANGDRIGTLQRKDLHGGLEITLSDMTGNTEWVIRTKSFDALTVFIASDGKKRESGHVKMLDDIGVIEMEDDTNTPLFRTVMGKRANALSVRDPRDQEKVYARMTAPTTSGRSSSRQVMIVDANVNQDMLLAFTVVLSFLT